MTTTVTQEAAERAIPQAGRTAREARRGYLMVLAATVCWSTSGTFIRLILTHFAFTAWSLAFWRDFISFAIFLGISVALGRGRLRLARKDIPRLAAMGAISIGIFHVIWNLTVAMIPIAVATVLNYTAPFFVILLAWLIWRERPNRVQNLSLVLAFIGCLLVTGAYNVGDAQLNWPGLVLGLLSGLTYGSMTIFSKDALKRYDPWTIMTYAFGFGALTIFVAHSALTMFAPQPGILTLSFGLPPEAWLSVGALALVSTVSGFGLYTTGLKYLSAGSASITATLEPVMATALALLLLGETIGLVQMLGGLSVILGVALLAAPSSRG